MKLRNIDASQLEGFPEVTWTSNSGTPYMGHAEDIISTMPGLIELEWHQHTMEQAMSVAEQLPRFVVLKRIKFDSNRDISAAGWRELLGALPPSIEEISLSNCIQISNESDENAGAGGYKCYAAQTPRQFAAPK